MGLTHQYPQALTKSILLIQQTKGQYHTMCGIDNTSNPQQEEEIPLDDLKEEPPKEKKFPTYYENNNDYKFFDV